MRFRMEIIDPYQGDREEGEWLVCIDFSWFRQRRRPSGFRGLSVTLFRWQFLLGQEVDL